MTPPKPASSPKQLPPKQYSGSLESFMKRAKKSSPAARRSKPMRRRTSMDSATPVVPPVSSPENTKLPPRRTKSMDPSSSAKRPTRRSRLMPNRSMDITPKTANNECSPSTTSSLLPNAILDVSSPETANGSDSPPPAPRRGRKKRSSSPSLGATRRERRSASCDKALSSRSSGDNRKSLQPPQSNSSSNDLSIDTTTTTSNTITSSSSSSHQKTTRTVRFGVAKKIIYEEEEQHVSTKWYRKEDLAMLVDHAIRINSRSVGGGGGSKKQKAMTKHCSWRGLEHIEKGFNKAQHVQKHVRGILALQKELKQSMNKISGEMPALDAVKQLYQASRYSSREDRKKAHEYGREDEHFAKEYSAQAAEAPATSRPLLAQVRSSSTRPSLGMQSLSMRSLRNFTRVLSVSDK